MTCLKAGNVVTCNDRAFVVVTTGFVYYRAQVKHLCLEQDSAR